MLIKNKLDRAVAYMNSGVCEWGVEQRNSPRSVMQVDRYHIEHQSKRRVLYSLWCLVFMMNQKEFCNTDGIQISVKP